MSEERDSVDAFDVDGKPLSPILQAIPKIICVDGRTIGYMDDSTRRGYLSKLVPVPVLLSGCVSSNHLDVDILNDSSTIQHVQLYVEKKGSDSAVIDERFGLDPGEEKEYPDVSSEPGEYRLDISVSGLQPKSYEWRSSRGSGATLHIAVTDSGIDIQTIIP